MLGLRTTAGIDLDAFAARYGVNLLVADAALLAQPEQEGRIRLATDPQGRRRLVPTLSGLAVADGLAAAFTLPDRW
jgi:coproporphyrinogen III oxidase-like Fe-S oxidoreductase